MSDLPLCENPPNSRHATSASSSSKRRSQTRPQALLIQTSSRPSLGSAPPTSLRAPSEQLAKVTEASVDSNITKSKGKYSLGYNNYESLFLRFLLTLAYNSCIFSAATRCVCPQSIPALQDARFRSITREVSDQHRQAGLTKPASAHGNGSCSNDMELIYLNTHIIITTHFPL